MVWALSWISQCCPSVTWYLPQEGLCLGTLKLWTFRCGCFWSLGHSSRKSDELSSVSVLKTSSKQQNLCVRCCWILVLHVNPQSMGDRHVWFTKRPCLLGKRLIPLQLAQSWSIKQLNWRERKGTDNSELSRGAVHSWMYVLLNSLGGRAVVSLTNA